MIDRFANDEQRARYVPSLCTMENRFLLPDRGRGWPDAAALKMRAVRDGDHYISERRQTGSFPAGASDVYVVMARTATSAGGVSTFIVDKGTPGLSFGANEKMGWNAQPTRQVICEDCRVPANNRVGEEGFGFKIAMAGLDGGRLNISACSLGGAQAALDRRRPIWATARRSGKGRRLPGAAVPPRRHGDRRRGGAHLPVARGERPGRQGPDAIKLCAMAKKFTTDACFEVANQALQLHGGYGYLAEYGIEKIVRDLRVHQILEGTNEIMRLIVSRKLLDGVR